MPTCATPGRGHLGLAAALSHCIPAWSLPGIGLPGTHVLHHGSLDRVKAHAAGIPRAVRSEERARGRARPGQQLATAELGWASASHPLGNQGPLVLRHGRADLSQQRIMRGITHRPLDTLDPTAALGACVDEEPLMHIVARSAIGGGEQHTFHGCQGHPIPESIQTGTLARGTAGASLTIEVLVGHLPSGMRRHVIA